MTNNKKSWFYFDPDKTFFELKIIKLTFLVGFSAALLSFTTIVYFSDISFRLDYIGFNTAANIFKVPIGLLMALIPIVALFAANHRSVQTKAQIMASKDSNYFTNFIKHRESFEKYIKSNAPQYAISTSFNKLYSALYPEAREGKLHLSKSSITELENELIRLTEVINITSTNLLDDSAISAIEDFENYLRSLGISSSFGERVQEDILNRLDQNNGMSALLDNIESELTGITQQLDYFLQFDPSYRNSLTQVLGQTMKKRIIK